MGKVLVKRRTRTYFLLWIRVGLLGLSFMPFVTCGKTILDTIEVPDDRDYDWIQLKSGEWLKGNFKVMYDYVVEFDSDELDLLEIDLEDVKQLRTRDQQVVRLQPRRDSREESEIYGRLTIRGDDVIIEVGDYDVHRKRDDIVVITDGSKKWWNYWSGFISLGINARGGNSETVDSSLMFTVKRRHAGNRLMVNYVGNFSEAGELETANNHRLAGTYDRFLTTKFFWRAVGMQYYRDPFSNINNQYSVGSAIGYDLIHIPKTEWDVSMGGGYQDQQFVSVAVNEDDRVNTPFFIAGTRYDTELTDRVDLLVDYSFRLLNERSGTFTHHALTKVSTEFIGDLDIDISLIWDHTQTPQEAGNGTVPAQDDYQLIFSLAYDF